MRILTIEELIAGKQLGYPKTLAPQATFKKAAAKKKAPRSSDRGHPEAMFEDGLMANEDYYGGSHGNSVFCPGEPVGRCGLPYVSVS